MRIKTHPRNESMKMLKVMPRDTKTSIREKLAAFIVTVFSLVRYDDWVLGSLGF